MFKAIAGILLALLFATPAAASCSMSWFAYGYTPTSAQWINCWNSKQDTLTYPPPTLTNGQVVVGVTGAAPAAVSLSGGIAALTSGGVATVVETAAGGTITDIAASGTAYLTYGNTTSSNPDAVALVSRETSFRNLRFLTDVAPGSGKTYTITLMTGTVPGAAMTPTALTCTITGGSSTSCSDTSSAVAMPVGYIWSVKITTLAGSTTIGTSAYSVDMRHE